MKNKNWFIKYLVYMRHLFYGWLITTILILVLYYKQADIETYLTNLGVNRAYTMCKAIEIPLLSALLILTVFILLVLINDFTARKTNHV